MEIWHNPRCRKSREALALLEEKGAAFEIREYLKETPSKEELTDLIKLLGIAPEKLIRKGEAIYKENFKGKALSDSEWIDAMVEFPKLIERPIVIKDGKAVVGRPSELVLDII